MMRAMMRRLSILLLGLGACTSSSKDSTTDTAPTLEITSPTRGTTVDGASVMVTGTATDDGEVTVTVNGTDTPVAADGSFTASVRLTGGISIIETHAIDTTGHDVRDVRAVLAGSLATSDGSTTSSVAAQASPAALTTIGKAIAADAKTIDYTSDAQALNPVYNNTGCLGAVIDITSIALSNVGVTLTPKSGALTTDVTLDNVVVKLKANFKVACIGGSTTITVSASAAHISGDLGASVSGSALATTLPSVSVTLDNFDLQVSGVPSEIVDLFNSHVQDAVQNSLASMIKSHVPSIANAKLGGLLSKGFSTNVLGIPTKLTVTPKTATISSAGLFVAVDTKVAVTGGAGGMFLSAPSPVSASLMSQTHGLGLAIECDLINEMFAGLWAAGAFDKTVPISTLSIAAALLDPSATQIALTLSLPPTVSSDGMGNLQLAIGDAMISVQDANATQLQQIAMSLSTALSATSTMGALALTLGTPTLYAQVLEQATDGSRQLTDDQIQGLITGLWGVLGTQASGALAKLPLPAIAGVQLEAPTVSSVQSYMVADIPLQ
jgi:hypothetical protein